MVELLAPAGSREALIAAVESGANAVYMAGNQFGARAYANNFDEDGLKEAIRFAHLRDVLINITVNTIVDDEEIPALKEYLLFLREAGADAIGWTSRSSRNTGSALRPMLDSPIRRTASAASIARSAGIRAQSSSAALPEAFGRWPRRRSTPPEYTI